MYESMYEQKDRILLTRNTKSYGTLLLIKRKYPEMVNRKNPQKW